MFIRAWAASTGHNLPAQPWFDDLGSFAMCLLVANASGTPESFFFIWMRFSLLVGCGSLTSERLRQVMDGPNKEWSARTHNLRSAILGTLFLQEGGGQQLYNCTPLFYFHKGLVIIHSFSCLFIMSCVYFIFCEEFFFSTGHITDMNAFVNNGMLFFSHVKDPAFWQSQLYQRSRAKYAQGSN